MPVAPLHPCPHPGCGVPIPRKDRWCPEHTRQHARQDSQRRNRDRTGEYGSRWQRLREIILGRSPLCACCEAHSQVRPANVVDHIVDHKGDQRLFWDESNLQTLCTPCHDARVDAGDFGRTASAPASHATCRAAVHERPGEVP